MKRICCLLPLLFLSCASSRAVPTSPPPSAPATAAQPPPASDSPKGEGRPAPGEIQAMAQKFGALLQGGKYAEALEVVSGLWARGVQSADLAYNGACAAARAGKLDDAFAWLERSNALAPVNLGWMEKDPDLASLRADGRYASFVKTIGEAQQRRLVELNVGGGLVPSTPEAEGIDSAALKTLLARAEATHSSALVLLRHGKRVGEWHFGGVSTPTETMSATKQVVNLAIGLLVDEGKIQSIDQPVSTWFPEWKDGVHDGITVRTLLNHTSGLHADRTTEKIYASKDFVRFALQSGVDAPPGTEFFYNNSAVNLLAGVVARASGEPMDSYLKRKLFAPLGIRDVQWTHDRAGNPHGMSGLQIHAVDFAKIGQLLLQRGMWNGQRILSERWIDASTGAPSQPFNPTCGLLWWLDAPDAHLIIDRAFLDSLKSRGADAGFVAKLATLENRPIPSGELLPTLVRTLGDGAIDAWVKEVGQRRLNPRTVVTGGYDGFSARGSFGQTMAVFPSRDLVAVRFTEQFDERDPSVNFTDFAQRVRALVPAPAHASSR